MYCEICDMENCADHGPGRERVAQRRQQALSDVEIQVAPSNKAHLVGCLHKGDDPDFTKWGFIRGVKGAWTRLGNGEHIDTTHGESRTATSRCMTCEETEPF
ncbi:MAG: hypothetical protein WKF57_06725 [Nakamurella sp.]